MGRRTDYRVHIVAPEIKGLSALSSSIIDAKGLNAVNGLSAHAESSAKMTLVGKCKTLDASASSASLIDASGLVCETVKVKADSAAHMKVNATLSASGTASSAANVHVDGSPKQKLIELSSAATAD